MEGRDSSIDQQALDIFFKEKEIDILVSPLEHSLNVRSAADALYPYHHNYYFLTDRDYHDDETVKRSWRNFPDANTNNLLIWRRREIENYFLIPEYLALSPYCKCSLEKLQQCVREAASKRVFLDVANLAILKLKEELDKEWIKLFAAKKTTGFDRRETALAKLMEKHEAAKQACDVLKKLHDYPILDHFTETTNKFFGGQDKLEFGQGIWLEMIKGKYVLPTVIDKCFRGVKNAAGRYIQGPERCMQVVKSLLKLPLEDQPGDFQDLYKLISARVSGKI